MKAILSILLKEFLQLRRDPRLFPVIFISPILQLLLLGYAADMDVKYIPSISATWTVLRRAGSSSTGS